MPEGSTGAVRPNRQAKSAASARSRMLVSAHLGAEKVMAQVRLRADEAASLDYSMRVLHINSTSEALREGLRLLYREAAEAEVASKHPRLLPGEAAAAS